MSTSPPSQPPFVTTTTVTSSSFPQSGQSHIVGIAAIAAPPPAETTPAPVRKFPAPCWTQEETLALISSYQDKWYSLRRRNLRTADWETVAEEVTRRVPGQTPPKTSAQCRHKMEKLRKRYRTEKQRIGALPNHGGGNNNSRFFGSSWVFFDLMNNLELGSSGSENNNNDNNNNNNLVGNNMNVPQISNVGKVDLEVKPYSMNMVKNDENSKKGDLGKYFDEILLSMGNRNEKGKSQNHEFDVIRSAPPHVKFKAKNNNHERNYNNHGYGGGGDMSNEFDGVDEYGGGGRNSGYSSGFKRKSSNYERYDEMHSPKMMALNGPRKESSGAGLGSRGRDSVVGEMVASIKMLGEGLVKMEKMKMEMMREIEQMRMQMEIKRSEMILESQHLIVNAFVEGMKKHKKVKAMEVE